VHVHFCALGCWLLLVVVLCCEIMSKSKAWKAHPLLLTWQPPMDPVRSGLGAQSSGGGSGAKRGLVLFGSGDAGGNALCWRFNCTENHIPASFFITARRDVFLGLVALEEV